MLIVYSHAVSFNADKSNNKIAVLNFDSVRFGAAKQKKKKQKRSQEIPSSILNNTSSLNADCEQKYIIIKENIHVNDLLKSYKS